jgi:hypothetical protein
MVDAMKVKKAKKTLEHYNKWRRGADIKQPEPKKIGEAIETAIELMDVNIKMMDSIAEYWDSKE